jgi:competence protein ComEC
VLSAWLMNRNKKYLQPGILCLFAYVVLQAYNNWQVMKQEKLVVYNVPQQQAIDLVSGKNYQFVGDSILLQEGLLQNFHLKPGRIALQLDQRVDSLNAIFHDQIFYQFNNKRIVIINKPVLFETPRQKINVDLVIISKNPKLYISQLAAFFNCKQFIFDASNPIWKIEKWQKECDDLHLPNYSIPLEGAFVIDIGM